MSWTRSHCVKPLVPLGAFREVPARKVTIPAARASTEAAPQRPPGARAAVPAGTPPKKRKRAASPQEPTPHRGHRISSQANGTPGCDDASPAHRPPQPGTALAAQIAALQGVRTRGGWSLGEGLAHIAAAADGALVPLLRAHGFPTFYARDDGTTTSAEASEATAGGSSCTAPVTFLALCRIVCGQQLHGAAATAVWARLQARFPPAAGQSKASSSLTPAAFLAAAAAAEGGLEALRAAVGLSGAKARALLALSEAFAGGGGGGGGGKRRNSAPTTPLCSQTPLLSDAVLLDPALSEEAAVALLTQVKGIGPWSAHMFLLFHAHRPDLLPLGDLGVRKGIAAHFGVGGGRGPRGTLHETKDAARMEALLAPFQPYRSLATWYMWRAAATPAASTEGQRRGPAPRD